MENQSSAEEQIRQEEERMKREEAEKTRQKALQGVDRNELIIEVTYSKKNETEFLAMKQQWFRDEIAPEDATDQVMKLVRAKIMAPTVKTTPQGTAPAATSPQAVKPPSQIRAEGATIEYGMLEWWSFKKGSDGKNMRCNPSEAGWAFTHPRDESKTELAKSLWEQCEYHDGVAELMMNGNPFKVKISENGQLFNRAPPGKERRSYG